MKRDAQRIDAAKKAGVEWQKWIESERGRDCLNTVIGPQRQLPLRNRSTPAYFENVLWEAFMAGWNRGEPQ